VVFSLRRALFSLFSCTIQKKAVPLHSQRFLTKNLHIST
jgi:hypothetical protein